MKFLVVLTVLAIAAGSAVNAQDPIKLSDEQKALVVQNAALCASEFKTSNEAVQALRKGQFDNVDQNGKCFTNCFLKKSGFLAEGRVKPDVITAKLGPIVGAKKINDIMATCNGLKGVDECDTAFQLYKCYHQQQVAGF